MATTKKVTRVESSGVDDRPAAPQPKDWKPTPEAKGTATKNRLIAALLWVLAIGAEAFTIFWLLHNTDIKLFMLWLIVAIVAIAGLAIGGSLLWKKANRYDPASKSDKVRFFVQNQLGVIIAAVAFLPLIILIFLNKDMDGKQKGIAGAIAIVLLLLAGFAGADFNPPSTELYSEKTTQVEQLTGQDLVYWTKYGTKYHLYDDCPAINKDKTTEIFEGTVGTAFAECTGLNKDEPLCKICEARYLKEHPDKASPGATGSNETSPTK